MAYIDAVSHGFLHAQLRGLPVMLVPSIADTGHYIHAFSTRLGGVSSGCYSSLNLSLTRGERSEVQRNYSILANALGLKKELMTACHYEHGTNVIVLSAGDAGAGVARENDLPFCDGVIVTDKSAVALTLHADCTPLFFADKKGRAAGVAHAGWKGTLGGIANNMIDALELPPEDILVGIGPSIRSCCFEVKDDVSRPFTELYGDSVKQERGGKQYIDLAAVTLMQLEQKGIPPKNVTLDGLCTYCRSDLFYSHRRDNGHTGAMASVIAFS